MTTTHSECTGCDHLAEALRMSLTPPRGPRLGPYMVSAFLVGCVFHAYVLPIVGKIIR